MDVAHRTETTPDSVIIDGRYRLGGLIGRGAVADVYAATDLRLQRPVALKLCRDAAYVDAPTPIGRAAGRGDAGERERREMRTLAQLDHPYIVRLLDAGVWRGTRYLVLDRVDGESLATRLRRAPLLAHEATQLAGQTASALAYLHGHGIVHRDLKPGNILLDRAGNARLVDFGTARQVGDDPLTATGLVIGTACYLAPEQVRGQGAGPAADIYALGLVLLEGLTGRREYDGTPAEAALARLATPPAIDADLPAPWPARLAAMTASDPAGRPSAADVAGWFDPDAAARPAAAADPTATAVLPTATVPPRRGTRFDREARILAGALGLLVATILGVAAWALAGTPSHQPPTHASTPTATPSASATHTAAPIAARQPAADLPPTPATHPAATHSAATNPAPPAKHGKHHHHGD